MTKAWTKLAVVSLLSGLPGLAAAQEFAPEPENPIQRMGMSLSLGAGLIGFTDEQTRDAMSMGGSWEARVAAGTKQILAVEAAYIGSAQPIDALGVNEALQVASSDGPQKVFVRGLLDGSGVTTTLLPCSEGTCCNESSGEFILAAHADAMVRNVAIRLSSSKNPSAFECRGDDSTSCWGFQSGEVIALGELHEARMVDPLLCKP